MQKVIIFSIIYLFSLTCYCQDPKSVITVKAKEINSIGIMPIKSSIETLKSKNDTEGNDQIKQAWVNQNVNVSFSLGLDTLMKYIELPSSKISLDTLSTLKYYEEIDSLLKFFPKNTKITKSILKDFLAKSEISIQTANIVKQKNERYGLCVVNIGFTRTKQSYSEFKDKISDIHGARLMSGLMFGGFGSILTHALTYTTDSYSRLITFSFIFDSETRKIVNCYFVGTELEPKDKTLNQKITKNHVFPCFSDYWIWFHSEVQKYLVVKRN